MTPPLQHGCRPLSKMKSKKTLETLSFASVLLASHVRAQTSESKEPSMTDNLG